MHDAGVPRDKVLAGIDAAARAGEGPSAPHQESNTVVKRGLNEDSDLPMGARLTSRTTGPRECASSKYMGSGGATPNGLAHGTDVGQPSGGDFGPAMIGRRGCPLAADFEPPKLSGARSANLVAVTRDGKRGDRPCVISSVSQTFCGRLHRARLVASGEGRSLHMPVRHEGHGTSQAGYLRYGPDRRGGFAEVLGASGAKRGRTRYSEIRLPPPNTDYVRSAASWRKVGDCRTSGADRIPDGGDLLRALDTDGSPGASWWPPLALLPSGRLAYGPGLFAI